jgi:hypothetical protein
MSSPEAINHSCIPFDAIKEEFDRVGLPADVEDGGAGDTSLTVRLPNGHVVLFGNINETWTGEFYESPADVAVALEMYSLDTHIRSEVTDPRVIVDSFRRTFLPGVIV